MGLLEELRQEIENAARASAAEAKAQAQQMSGRPGTPFPKPGRNINTPPPRRLSAAASTPTERVGGRLQRERLEKGSPVGASEQPSIESYRRKIAAMEAGEPTGAVGAGFDLGLDEPASAAAAPPVITPTTSPASTNQSTVGKITFTPADFIRAIALGGILSEPGCRKSILK